MSLTKVLALEALRNFVNDWYENEIQQNVKDHVTPVSFFRAGCSNSQKNDEQHSNHDDAVANRIIHEDFSSVVLHHNCAQIKRILEITESYLFLWKR